MGFTLDHTFYLYHNSPVFGQGSSSSRSDWENSFYSRYVSLFIYLNHIFNTHSLLFILCNGNPKSVWIVEMITMHHAPWESVHHGYMFVVCSNNNLEFFMS